jgi:hypothetical protein
MMLHPAPDGTISLSSGVSSNSFSTKSFLNHQLLAEKSPENVKPGSVASAPSKALPIPVSSIPT